MKRIACRTLTGLERPSFLRFSILLLVLIDIVAITEPLNADPSPGYTHYAARGSGTTYLIDIDGYTVHTWQSNYNPAASEYLLEDTTLLRTAIASGSTRFGSTGGKGGRVELFDWDSNLLWSYEHATNNYMLHHDIEMLPNGNILMIVWEYKTQSEAIAAGRNPSLLTISGLWPDKIIEVEPTGSSGGNIVWEWHA